MRDTKGTFIYARACVCVVSVTVSVTVMCRGRGRGRGRGRCMYVYLVCEREREEKGERRREKGGDEMHCIIWYGMDCCILRMSCFSLIHSRASERAGCWVSEWVSE